jgi:hypothetical protein
MTFSFFAFDSFSAFVLTMIAVPSANNLRKSLPSSPKAAIFWKPEGMHYPS